MALESLLELAFTRGCGASRVHALRTPRYRELLASAPRIPNTTQQETAEMIYLGERLADRAFTNLPYKIRRRAERWSEMDYLEKHFTLNMLMSRLTTHEWCRIHRDKVDQDNDVSRVSPAEYGSWSRGNVQPNCLGLTQMLIGFARATGAEHLMVDAITQFDQYNEELLEQLTRKMIAELEPHREVPGIGRTIRKLETLHESALSVLVRFVEIQAHHALLIKVDQEWVVVDPYMGRKYPLPGLSKPRFDIYSASMAQPRRRWMVYGGVARRAACLRSVDALERALTFVARRDEAAAGFGLSDAAEEVFAPFYCANVERTESKVTEDAADSVFYHIILESLLTWTQQKSWKPGANMPTAVKRSLPSQLQRADRTKRARNAALVRLVKHICQTGLDVIFSSSQQRRSDHRRIEIAHPALHLAVMTLNHIGTMTNEPKADLLRYDTSQWIIHDTLKEVMSSNDKRLRRIVEGNLRILKNYPHMVMPALLAEITKRE